MILRAPNADTQRIAAEYKAKTGFGTPYHGNISLHPETSRKIADAWEGLKHNPDDPAVAESYHHLKQETLAQHDHLVANGYKFTAHPVGAGEPYKDSAEMMADVRDNKHLKYLPTGSGFGTNTTDGLHNHPMLEKVKGMKDSNGDDVSYNDLFRVVHDVFGHTPHGHQFGPLGEERAFHAHASLYSEKALGALNSETRAQNSWVNYGKHMRRPDGSVPKPGDPDHVPFAERAFSPQKAALLPRELWDIHPDQIPTRVKKALLPFTQARYEPGPSARMGGQKMDYPIHGSQPNADPVHHKPSQEGNGEYRPFHEPSLPHAEAIANAFKEHIGHDRSWYSQEPYSDASHWVFPNGQVTKLHPDKDLHEDYAAHAISGPGREQHVLEVAREAERNIHHGDSYVKAALTHSRMGRLAVQHGGQFPGSASYEFHHPPTEGQIKTLAELDSALPGNGLHWEHSDKDRSHISHGVGTRSLQQYADKLKGEAAGRGVVYKSVEGEGIVLEGWELVVKADSDGEFRMPAEVREKVLAHLRSKGDMRDQGYARGSYWVLPDGGIHGRQSASDSAAHSTMAREAYRAAGHEFGLAAGDKRVEGNTIHAVAPIRQMMRDTGAVRVNTSMPGGTSGVEIHGAPTRRQLTSIFHLHDASGNNKFAWEYHDPEARSDWGDAAKHGNDIESLYDSVKNLRPGKAAFGGEDVKKAITSLNAPIPEVPHGEKLTQYMFKENGGEDYGFLDDHSGPTTQARWLSPNGVPTANLPTHAEGAHFAIHGEGSKPNIRDLYVPYDTPRRGDALHDAVFNHSRMIRVSAIHSGGRKASGGIEFQHEPTSRQMRFIHEFAGTVAPGGFNWSRRGSDGKQVAYGSSIRDLMAHLHGESVTKSVDGHLLVEARSKVEPPKSEAQAEAGNYPKGRVQWNGMTVVIENPKGSTRKDMKNDPPKWSVTMKYDYGYIAGTKSCDGDALDITLGPKHALENVYVVNQVDQNGKFDEPKVIGCVGSVEEAKQVYLSGFSKGWKCGTIVYFPSKEQFKEWAFGGKIAKEPVKDPS